MNKILHFIDQKTQEIKKLRLERQSNFRPEARTPAKIPEHSQKPKLNTRQQSKPEPLSQMSPGGLQEKPVSSMSRLKAFFSPPEKNRLSRESSTLGSPPSSAKSEAFAPDIKFNHLDNSEKNVTLSADGSLFVFWNKEQLEVHDDGGYKTAVSHLVSNPMLVTASTNCCAVVGQKENCDTV